MSRHRAPSHLHQQAAVKSPNLPQPVLLSGSNTAKLRQKTGEFDAFLPAAHPSASKKVNENKDTIR